LWCNPPTHAFQLIHPLILGFRRRSDAPPLVAKEATMSTSSLRGEVLAVLLRALSQDGQPCFPATATFTDANGGELTFRFVRYDVLALTGLHAEPDPPPTVATRIDGNGYVRIRRLHRRLYEAASDEPTPTKVLIKEAGYPVHSDSRSAVTAMIRAGHLERTPDGVKRGRVPLPGTCQADEPDDDDSPSGI
jgi:hypothetical protein